MVLQGWRESPRSSPARIQSVIDASSAFVSAHSRSLNYIFSLSAIGVSEHFTSYTGQGSSDFSKLKPSHRFLFCHW
jgi:hypothetical protein